MRWFWLDRFNEFVVGKRAVAVKNITLTDEPIEDYSPGRPYFPATIVVEALAQTGGLLISQLSDFKNKVVLAKVNKSKFHFQAEPGDQLVLEAIVETLQDAGAVVAGKVTVGSRTMVEAELTFAYLDERFENVELFEPAFFCRTLRCMKLFDVARHEDGSPIQVPEHMLEAERQEVGIT